MGKATGAFLIIAGIGTAALVLPAVDKDAEKQLADVVRIATGGQSQASQANAGTKAAAAVTAQTSAFTTSAGRPANSAQAQPANPIANVILAPASSTSVTPVIAPVAQPATDASRADHSDAKVATLARDIQRELKRVGCFEGDISGDWNTATRKAMKTFVDRVNATLPIDAPDHILKTLVQGHPGNACGTTCPTGQAIATDGRCLPTAVIAKRDGGLAKKRVASTADATAQKPKAPRVDAEAKPPSTPATKSAESSSWMTTTETNVAQLPAPSALPGRMAIGGPKADSPLNSSTTQVSPPLAAREAARPAQIAALPATTASEPDDTAERRAESKASAPAPGRRATVRSVRRASLPPANVYRQAPPAVVRYAAPAWTVPARRFGPHIFNDQARWAR